MADLYANDTAGLGQRPIVKPSSGAYGGRARPFRAVVTLATQTVADNILLCVLPAGTYITQCSITSSISLGAAQVAVGFSKVHATNGQIRAANVFTGVDAPVWFGTAAVLSAGPLTQDTPIYLTIAVASLPAVGTLILHIGNSND